MSKRTAENGVAEVPWALVHDARTWASVACLVKETSCLMGVHLRREQQQPVT